MTGVPSRWACAVLALAGCVLTALPGHALDAARITERNEPAVLVITGRKADTGALVQGSGFCVDTRGLVMATAHQVANVTGLEGRLNTGETFPLSVVSVDEQREVSLLDAGRELPAAVFVGDANALTKGDPLLCLASPRGLDFTVARGIVSGMNRSYRDLPVLQTDIPASPGSSGGPVFDRFGNAVGFIILYLQQDTWVVFMNPINNAYPLLQEHGVPIHTTALPGDDEAELVPVADISERELRAIEAYNRGVAAEGAADKVAAYEVAVLVLPAFYEAQFNLGVARTAARDLEGAIAAYGEAAALRPGAAAPYRNLGRLYLKTQAYEDAIAAFERAAEAAPEDAQSHNDLGEAFRRAGRLAEAASAFRRGLALDPEHAGAQYNLGLVLARQGKGAAAVEAFEAYLALQPAAEDAEQVRGWIDELRK